MTGDSGTMKKFVVFGLVYTFVFSLVLSLLSIPTAEIIEIVPIATVLCSGLFLFMNKSARYN